MTAFLEHELTQFALCWRLERADGVAIGLTAHDRDLWIDGFRYRAAPGMTPSAIEEGDPVEAGALSVAGALDAEAITTDDLRAGRWNGAEMRVLLVDWTDPSDRIELCRGELGGVTTSRDSFRAEVRGLGARLRRTVIEETSPLCRADLGDRRCRVAKRRTIASIVAATGDEITLQAAPGPDGTFAFGRLRWLEGPNGGLTSHVRAQSGATLTLVEPPVFATAEGSVELIEGCDKRFATCRDRFGNAANFRGEPHLPGIDLLTRYPGE